MSDLPPDRGRAPYDFHFHTSTPAVPICDFCSATPVLWSYPARPHKSGTGSVVMGGGGPTVSLDFFDADGAWAACAQCHSLIQRSDRDGLAKLSVKRLKKKNGGSYPGGMSKADATRMIRGVHDNFWKNRKGAPIPIHEHLKGD